MATETDKVKTGALGTLVAVGLFATVSIMLAVTALVRYSTRGVADQRQDLAEQPYRELRSAQNGKLGSTPTWTDKGQGKVSMPIERAKAKVLAELARDPSSATPPAPASAATAASADAGVAAGEEAPGAVKGEKTPAPAPSAAPAPTATHAALEKKSAPAAATVATAKPAAPTTAAVAAPAAPPAPAAPAAPKPTDG
jgi:hypothetical protein